MPAKYPDIKVSLSRMQKPLQVCVRLALCRGKVSKVEQRVYVQTALDIPTFDAQLIYAREWVTVVT